MSMSKVFSVKSNAVRHAVKLGMTREAAYKVLEAVSGGYQFALPSNEFISENTGRVMPGVDAILEANDEPTDAELNAGRAEHTITNGQHAVSFGPSAATLKALGAELVEPTTIAAAVKAPRKRQAKAPKAVKPAKAPKVAKPAKAPKVPRQPTAKATGTAKRGTPEYDAVMAARRKSQGRRGVMDATVTLLRKKWVGAAELMEMNEWQSSTLRGLLSLEKKKQGFNLKSRKVDGATEYHIGS